MAKWPEPLQDYKEFIQAFWYLIIIIIIMIIVG